MRYIIFIVALACCVSPALAVEWTHINGSSYHPNARGLNENNPGVGWSKDVWVTGTRYTRFELVDTFVDSLGNQSMMIGSGVRADFAGVEVGVTAFMMYRQEGAPVNVFPGVLPHIAFGPKMWKVELHYVPGVLDKRDEAVTMRLRVRR